MKSIPLDKFLKDSFSPAARARIEEKADAVIERLKRKGKARRSQCKGSQVEQIAALRLIYLGFHMVLKIATPMAKIRGKWTHSGKAEGDLRAVGPLGESVLAEVKSRPEILKFSDLEPHQVMRLDQHMALGGISLLAWHNRGGLHILPWDACRSVGFGPGCSLDIRWADAQQLKREQMR